MNNRVKKIFEMFTTAGSEVRLAGGCVRDMILGVNPKDFDFCTPMLPNQMIDLGKKNNVKVIPTGIDHGTVTFMIDCEGFEVTTLRIDQDCDGRHASVRFTDDWKKDAERRDLTINAMMMDQTGKVFDWFDGQDDLQTRTIRFVGNAEDRVSEDFLRILRFFRFANKFNKPVSFDREGMEAIKTLRTGLINVSVERIWSELQKMFVGPNAVQIVEAMNETLVGHMMTEIWGADNQVMKLAFRKDIEVVQHLKNTDALTVMAGLTTDANRLADQLKMSNSERAKMVWLFENWQNLTETTAKNAMVDGISGEWIFRAGQMANNPSVQFIGATFNPPVFPVTGKDLLSSGMKPGPQMGQMLKAMKDLWKASDFTISRELLLKMV